MTRRAILLDTSFFMRFLNYGDPLFNNADGYFRYFLQKEIIMMISTISIAEYCVGGDIQELPPNSVFVSCQYLEVSCPRSIANYALLYLICPF